MCHKSAKHLLSWLLFVSSGTAAHAQNASNRENMPYSRFGVGELQSGTNVLARGMGYLNAAWINPYAVNSENPASYASLKFTTYELGISGGGRTLRADGEEYKTGTASLAYLNVGIPVGKHAGLNLGMKPYSRVYYRSQQDSTVPGLGDNSYIYSGDGGLNYAFLGASGTYGGLSLGVNAGYMFGTTRYSSVMQQVGTGVQMLSSEFSRYHKMGGIYWTSGLAYETPVSKSLKLRVGATYAMGQNLNVWRDEYWLNFRTLNGVLDRDTILRVVEERGTMTLPTTANIGIMLTGNETWSVGADFSTMRWSQYRKFGQVDSVTDQSYRISVGASLTPDATALYNYLQRVTYRLGVYYGKDYARLRNTDIEYYALTIGASLPFRRSPDRIHTAFEIGRRGTEAQGLVRENFYRLSVGLSLNDRWFIKRKYH